MKTITKYEDEISGFVFDSEEKALDSEKISVEVQRAFEWVPQFEERTRTSSDTTCSFSNGMWSVKWNKDGFEKISKDIAIGHRIVPRAYLIHWTGLMNCICPKCFRVYGQPYFAINCECENSKIPTRKIS